VLEEEEHVERDDKGDYILQLKIDFAKENLKNNKACGTDEVPAELIKCVDEGMSRKLGNLCNEMNLTRK